VETLCRGAEGSFFDRSKNRLRTSPIKISNQESHTDSLPLDPLKSMLNLAFSVDTGWVRQYNQY
jgi:hypothetical protein